MALLAISFFNYSNYVRLFIPSVKCTDRNGIPRDVGAKSVAAHTGGETEAYGVAVYSLRKDNLNCRNTFADFFWPSKIATPKKEV